MCSAKKQSGDWFRNCIPSGFAVLVAVWCGCLAASCTNVAEGQTTTKSSAPAMRVETRWLAGVARADITPKIPMAMAGYGGRDTPATGTLTQLWAKALVLEDAANQRVALVTLDLVGIGKDLSDSIRDTLNTRLDLSRKQIILSTSHTHTGPVVGMNLAPLHYRILPVEQQQLIDDYATALERQVVDLVEEASKDLVPVRLGAGFGSCDFAVNRRENKPYEEAPARRSAGTLKGPVDHDVPVLSIRDDEGDLLAVVFGYACHATVLSSLQWSGDYPAYAQQALEDDLPGCMAMFWAGCGADQNPLPRRTIQLAKHYGEKLAAAVEAVLLTTEMEELSSVVQTDYQEIDLPFAELPTTDQLKNDSRSGNRYTAARAQMLLEKIEQRPLATTYPYPVTTWRLGNRIDWIALGGEVVVDYSVRLKAELRGKRTWVTAYANDVMAYIPSRRVLAEGGYEGATAMVYYGLPTSWAPTIEEAIVTEVHRQLGTAEE